MRNIYTFAVHIYIFFVVLYITHSLYSKVWNTPPYVLYTMGKALMGIQNLAGDSNYYMYEEKIGFEDNLIVQIYKKLS